MIKISFSLRLPGGGFVAGVAKVMLPFFIELDFEELDLKGEDVDDEELKSFLKLQVEVAAKDIVKKGTFVYANENYPGQVCLN